MKTVGELFLKYEKILLQDAEVKNHIHGVLKKIIKRDIPLQSITIKNNTISVHTTPLEKQELFMNKELLLEELRKDIPSFKILAIK